MSGPRHSACSSATGLATVAWLGKQYLGQTDEMSVNTNTQIVHCLFLPTAPASKDMPTDIIVNPPTVIDTRAESERRLIE